MGKKATSGIMLTVVLLIISMLVFSIEPVKATQTIYIRADGSVDPPAAPIQRDGDLHTFTDSIYDSIVVERNSTIIDGAGYTIQGTGSGTGIDLSYRKNVTIKNMQIELFYYGIKLAYSLNNTISGNNLTTNYYSGIDLWGSSHNTIYGNNIAERHSFGIKLDQSSNHNIISGNDITENGWGIKLSSSNNNTVFRNNIAANEQNGIEVFYSSNNSMYENSIANNQKLGIMLSGSSNYNNIYGNKITNNEFGGIRLHGSLKSSVCGNNITGHLHGYGIKLEYSLNYSLSGNSIANNQWGIEFEYSSNYNSVYANNITDNEYGIWFWNSSSNSIYHNNFVNNSVHKITSIPYLVNVWDDGYPSGGNYWSNLTGVDLYKGPYQNETGSDGIGDTPYLIDNNNQDRYPLISPWIDVTKPVANAGQDQTVNVGTTVTFDASASMDNVGIVSYKWDFGDDTTGMGKTTTHIYTSQGTYAVTLTVQDPAGNSATDTMILTVLPSEAPPPPAEGFPLWIIGVAVATVAIATVAIAVFWRRRK